MKVCLFTISTLPPGGAEWATHHLGNALVELGHDVWLLYRRPYAKDPPSVVAGGHGLYRPYGYWVPRSRGLLEQPAACLYLGLFHLVKRFDVVHTAQAVYPNGFCALQVRRFIQVPIVVTAQGDDIQVEPEYGYGIRLDPQIDRKVRSTLRQADAVTTLSRAMREEIEGLGIPGPKVTVIPNGVPFQCFASQENISSSHPARHPGGRPYLLAMGRLVHKKGFDLLIRAFAQVVRTSRIKVDLVIAGEGPEQSKLEALIRELGLEGRVWLVGFLGESEKAVYLRHALFFICPSRREPFGIVNLEAMASGKAVVGAAVDGIPDIVTHMENGLLFRAGDVADLGGAIGRLINDQPLRETLGQHARQTAAQFDWQRIGELYEDVYRKVARKPRQVAWM